MDKDFEQKIITDMSDMIKCRTVSNYDYDKVDWNEFEKFRSLLRQRFPTIYSTCEFLSLGKSEIVHKIKGTDGNENHAVVLMAHYDVVPTEGQQWDFDPFSGQVKDGFILGRGTLDTKGTLCSCMEAVEYKLKEGWLPKQNLYLCFSGEEETNGPSAEKIAQWFTEKNIEVDFVLDEGGAIVDKSFPGIDKRCAMVGTAEKGSTYYKLSVEGKAGHASSPPKHSSVAVLGKLLVLLGKKSSKAEFTKPALDLFKIMGENNKNPILKFIFKNCKINKPIIALISKITGGELNAMLHTTCALTTLEGSNAYNVLPQEAIAGLNYRLLGSDTSDKAIARLEKYAKKVCGKKAKFKIEKVMEYNPSRVSETNCTQWENLSAAISETWNDVLISPYLMVACSDSRHFSKISDKVYRFSGMYLSKEERAMIHGTNEKIPCDTLMQTVTFYINLVEKL